MDSVAFTKALLLNRAWQQSHDNAYQGLLVEMFILKNRVDAGFGNWRQVIQRADSIAGNLPCPVRDLPSDYDPLFRRLLSEIDSIYDGTRNDEMTRVQGFKTTDKGSLFPTVVHGLYYADLSKPLTPFLKDKILADPTNHKRIATVGSLTVFS